MRFSQRIFGPKSIPQVEHNIVSFGLNQSSVRGKDGLMGMLEGSLHKHPPRNTRRNVLPVKHIDGSLLMGHQYLAGALV
jgi:hypothetical protein